MLKELITTFVISASASDVDVTNHNVQQYLDKQLRLVLQKICTTKSRSQGLAGQLAVSLVVLNRVKDDRFLTQFVKLCIKGLSESLGKLKVRLFQRVNEHITQYEIVANLVGTVTVNVDEPKEPTTYGALYDITLDLVYGDITVVDITEGATHYHADYVYPAWRKTKTKTIEIEDHIFYRWENDTKRLCKKV